MPQFITDNTITDPKIVKVLDILRETYEISEDVESVQAFFQKELFKGALFYDKLQENGETNNIVTLDQAKRILEIYSDVYEDNIPEFLTVQDDENPNSYSLIVMMGLVKPTINLRINDLKKLLKLGYYNKIYLSIPGDIKPEMKEYLEENINDLNIQDNNIEFIYSDVTINHQERNMEQLVEKENFNKYEKFVVLTDKTFYDKMPIVCNKLGEQLVGSCYFYIDENEKALCYGYNIANERELLNWVGNILNFSVARAFNNFYTE